MALKLSKRLSQINKMVTSDYTHIWDCCCDHGLLGAALLSRQAAKTIHFVDIVPELMSLLENKLQRFYSDETWKTHCIDVANLPLAQYKGKQLIIIAGIGSDLMIKFIEAIHNKHNNLSIDFLLCPVHHQFLLREKLIELNFNLKHETLVEDNKRFYETLLVTSSGNTGKKISAVGEDIWQHKLNEPTEVAQKYLNKTLSHYQRIKKGNTNNVQHIIDAYQALTLKVKAKSVNTYDVNE